MARARLRDRHQQNLRRKLQLLKREQGVQPDQPAHPDQPARPDQSARPDQADQTDHSEREDAERGYVVLYISYDVNVYGRNSTITFLIDLMLIYL